MEPLPSTFVTKQESNKRAQWFNDYKYPILNILTSLQEGKQENKKLDFENIKVAIDFFKLLRNSIKEGEGVRAYFASKSGDGSVKEGKCGLLTLIFNATTGANNSDVKNYYAYNGKTFDKIQEDKARAWVHKYQSVKRPGLFETLSESDRLKGNRETKHIWFSFVQMDQTIKEMEYQVSKPGSRVTGFGIRFVSYTDQDYWFPKPEPLKYERRQRLTIAFTFINDKKEDIGIEDLGGDEFNERLRLTVDRFIGDTFDTGIPAPPPSDTREALDLEI